MPLLKLRFTFNKNPISESLFLTAWQATFKLEMMHYPVLTRVKNGVQYYLQKRNLMIRTTQDSQQIRLTKDNYSKTVEEYFGTNRLSIESVLEITLSKYKNFFN